MKLRHKVIISGGIGIILLIAILGPIKMLNNPTPLTKNIAPTTDVYVKETDPSGRTMLVYPDRNILEVGKDAASNAPVTSYIRFDLSSVQNRDPFTTVTCSAVLRLLGWAPFPPNASDNNNYIMTVAQIDCKNPYWKKTEWNPSNCPFSTIDASTESSIVIRGKSMPDFYEWTVTSALEKALQTPEKQATFRITGYPLNASNNYNGGIQFWSKHSANYFKNFWAGPTDVLILTTTIAASPLFNSLYWGNR